VAQYDGMPLNSAWPTTCWQTQHGFNDQYRLMLPPDIAPGAYRLSLGWYVSPLQQRLPVYDGATARGNRLMLQEITVRP
jgi:hypothetical protein